MKRHILDLMGKIDEKYVLEAAEGTKIAQDAGQRKAPRGAAAVRERRTRWSWSGAAAAGLLIAIAAATVTAFLKHAPSSVQTQTSEGNGLAAAPSTSEGNVLVETTQSGEARETEAVSDLAQLAAGAEQAVWDYFDEKKAAEECLSLSVEFVGWDEEATEHTRIAYGGSPLAKSRGWTAETIAHRVVVRARFTVTYDHEKTFLPDGDLHGWYLLIQNPETGNWRVEETVESEDEPNFFENPVSGEIASAEEAVRTYLLDKEASEECLSLSVEFVGWDEEATENTRAAFSGSPLAESKGWTAETIDHMVVVRARFTVAYDHTKTFMSDGDTYGWYLVVRDADGTWRVEDASESLSPQDFYTGVG